MKIYKVYLINGYEITIESDNFNIDYDKKRVKFEIGDENVAFFNFENIAGFMRV